MKMVCYKTTATQQIPATGQHYPVGALAAMDL
jgi:hypothetical protein